DDLAERRHRVVVDQGGDDVYPEARLRDRGKGVLRAHHDRLQSGPAAHPGPEARRHQRAGLAGRQCRSHHQAGARARLQGPLHPHRAGRYLGGGEHRRQGERRGYVGTRLRPGSAAREDQELAGALHQEVRRVERHQHRLRQPGLRLRRGGQEGAERRSKEGRRRPQRRRVRESVGQGALRRQRVLRHRQSDHLPDAVLRGEGRGRDARDAAITAAQLIRWGPRRAPQAPRARRRPGEAGAPPGRRGSKGTMTFALLVQSAVVGVSLASIYILMALGLTLMFGMMHIINFAHGAVYMLGAFVIYYVFFQGGMSYFAAFVASMILLGVFGYLVERSIYRPIKGGIEPTLVALLALTTFLQAAGYPVFGQLDKHVPPVFPGTRNILGVGISIERLMIIPVAAAL